jgi:hypothetical protein
MAEVKRLIAEVYARDGIRIEAGDPAFALATITRLVLEDAAEQISEHIRSGLAEFAEAVHKTEARAGKVLAEQVKEIAAELRSELEADVEKARLDVTQILLAVNAAHNRPASIRWGITAGAISALLFTTGLWIGANFLR